MAVALALAVAALAAFAPAASAVSSERALHILIAFSDGAHNEQAIKDELAVQPHVAVVDTVDASMHTPTVATLDTYDAVVVYSNTDYADPVTLGNNLASYADAGGAVIEFNFDWVARAQRQLGGRFADSGYSPYTVGGTDAVPTGPLGEHAASSPFLAGVTSLGASLSVNPTLAPGAVEVAKWSDGRSAVAFKGRVLGVNACVADGCTPFDPGFARIIANAAEIRVAGQLFTPDKACNPDTFFQTGVSGGNPYFVPRSGVITAWYSQAAGAPVSNLALEVGRSLASPDLVIAGTSPAGPQQPDQVNGPYGARIPVDGTDLIGIFTDGATGLCSKGTGEIADSFAFSSGHAPTGTTITPMDGSGARLDVEAVVEPDLDGDNFGDLSQDACPDVAGTDGGCPAAGSPPQPPSTPPAAPADPARPAVAVISEVRQTNRRWRESRRSKLAHASRSTTPVGTTFSFRLDRPAPVRLDFFRHGRRKANGIIRVSGHPGTNRVRFLGYLTRTKRLKPGIYAVRIAATTPGAGSTSKTLSFRILR